MKHFLTALLIAGLPITANAGSIQTLGRGQATDFNGRNCAIVVMLGSHAGGIDHALAGRLKSKLAGTKVAKRTTIRQWGREGELSFCVEAAGSKMSARNYVKNILRSYGKPKRGYVKLTGALR